MFGTHVFFGLNPQGWISGLMVAAFNKLQHICQIKHTGKTCNNLVL